MHSGVIHQCYSTSLPPGVFACSLMALDAASHWEAICIDKAEKLAVSMSPLYMERDPGRKLAVLLAVRRGDHAHEAFGRWAGSRIALRGVHGFGIAGVMKHRLCLKCLKWCFWLASSQRATEAKDVVSPSPH
jgi:hypothetical protein